MANVRNLRDIFKENTKKKRHVGNLGFLKHFKNLMGFQQIILFIFFMENIFNNDNPYKLKKR